jgi:hypothetical protein
VLRPPPTYRSAIRTGVSLGIGHMIVVRRGAHTLCGGRGSMVKGGMQHQVISSGSGKMGILPGERFSARAWRVCAWGAVTETG